MTRRKYKEYWRPVVERMIREYPGIKSHTDFQARLMTYAIEKTMEETSRMPDGLLRLRVIGLVYMAKSHSLDGAAMKVHASRRTVQRWIDDFMRRVAVHSAYTENSEIGASRT